MASLEDHLSKARRLAEKGKWREAVEEYERAIAIDPNDARVRLKSSDAALKAGDLARAADALLEAAAIFERSGFGLKAVATLREVLTIDPSRAAVHLALARAYAQLQLVDEARAAIDRYLATLPDDGGPRGYREGASIADRAALARAKLSAGEIDAAIAELAALGRR